MGILTIATFMTLDGIMQAPGGPDEDRDRGFVHGGWSFPYAGDDMRDVISAAIGQADCFLLGRRTYEIFAASWPNFPDPNDPVASRLNTRPKYVVSTTLASAAWQPTTIIRGDIAAEVAKLKEQHAGEIQIHGSATLAQTLHAYGLVDEYRLFIEPVVLGTGKRLFEPGATPTALQLIETKPMDKGSVLAIYRPAGRPTYGAFQMEEGLGLPKAEAPS
jgi:dihydrofolate reductase